MDSRKNQYKPTTSAGSASLRNKKRDEKNVLRKDKREKVLLRKRTRHGVSESSEYEITTDQIKDLTNKLMTKKEDKVLYLKLLRSGFAQGTALIDAFLQVDNAMPCLISLLTGSDAEVQLMATWCLTNISAGTEQHAMTVARHASSYLITYLSSPSAPLQDQCAWTLGNLAGEGEEERKLLMQQGVVAALVPLLKSACSNVVKSAAFALSNLARSSEAKQKMVEMNVVDALVHLLELKNGAEDVITESLWVLTYLTACPEYAKTLSDAGVLKKVLNLLYEASKHEEPNVLLVTPLLRCLGNMMCDSEVMSTQDNQELVSDARLYESIDKFMHHSVLHLQKEGLWVLSNLAVYEPLCQKLIKCNLLPTVISLLNSAYNIRYEAAYCLCNIAQHGDDICREIFKQHAIPNIVPTLKSHDLELVSMSLSLIQMIMQASQEMAVKEFEEHGGLNGLELLEYNDNLTISQKTNHILDNFIYKYMTVKE
ncbi:hypothetical protein HELRODRAFT_185404 [Helobdella robusta]|uniref:Importin subunit alpha n=1 Tax=Helobdella robusta TaxID=6412 RepID=T1FMR8_HELRO|nr:hypothetical protein HELRODRAFT_185404 [Helobdella robusta]ESO08615.1 hypothetical protein HELRODRAFT_185404 [Helobdella robusta]